MSEYQYRAIKITTVDYGDGPAAGFTTIATLAVIPDGSHWQARPETIAICVPFGTRPGVLYRVIIEEIESALDQEGGAG